MSSHRRAVYDRPLADRQQDIIYVPPHPNCCRNNEEIIASFHTHPNTGPDYLDEPSEADLLAVEDDPALKASYYIGEFVLSESALFLVLPEGGYVVVAGSEWLFPPINVQE